MPQCLPQESAASVVNARIGPLPSGQEFSSVMTQGSTFSGLCKAVCRRGISGKVLDANH